MTIKPTSNTYNDQIQMATLHISSYHAPLFRAHLTEAILWETTGQSRSPASKNSGFRRKTSKNTLLT